VSAAGLDVSAELTRVIFGEGRGLGEAVSSDDASA
jgi:hypothetical protein